jgi:cyanophycinase-like exopeptidase
LVLSGGGDLQDQDTIEIVTQVLSRTISHGPLAYVWAAGDIEYADKYLEYLADLGGRTGYLVDILTEDDETVLQQLSEAGIVLLGDGPDIQRLRSGLGGPGMAGIKKAYAQGATVFGQGAGAMVLGQAILTGEENRPGFNWLEQALVLHNYDESKANLLHDFLRQQPDTYGLALSQGAAVAFLPNGAVEVWGNKRIIVSLGRGLSRSSGD